MRTLKFLRGTEAGGAGPGVRRAPLRSSWLIFRETEGCEHRAWPVREPGGRGHGHPRTPRGQREKRDGVDVEPRLRGGKTQRGRAGASGGGRAVANAGTKGRRRGGRRIPCGHRERLCVANNCVANGSARGAPQVRPAAGAGGTPVPSLGPAPTADVQTGCSVWLALLSPTRRRTAGGAGSRWVSVAATSSAASDGDPGCAQTSSADRPRRATALGGPFRSAGGPGGQFFSGQSNTKLRMAGCDKVCGNEGGSLNKKKK